MSIRLGILLIVLLLNSHGAFSQLRDYDKVWVQGNGVVYSTTFNGPSTPTNGFLDTVNHHYYSLGHSNICDSTGNLLLLCDGYNIYDRNGQFIEDGDTIVPKALYKHYSGFTRSAQSSIILPFDNGIFRVVTPTASDSETANYWWNFPSKGRALFDLLLYNEVDMKANSGHGKVTKRMVPLLQGAMLSKTQMMACRHGDGKSWWLLKQASDTNVVYKFLFTQDTIFGPYIQSFPEPHFTKWDICGQSVFSVDGTKYATTVQNAKKVFLADFDRCTGKLSNPVVIDVPLQSTQNPGNPPEKDSSTNGLAFSPSGRYLYVNGFYTIQQLDLTDSNPATAWSNIAGPDTTWGDFQQYANMYLAPDGKIYVGNWNGLCGQMSVITSPDNKGAASNFCPKCLRFPSFNFNGVARHIAVSAPPCMPNYHLGQTIPLCLPTGVGKVKTSDIPFQAYPNPANGFVSLQYDQQGVFQLFDITGRIVNTTLLPSPSHGIFRLQTDIMPSGLYTYRYTAKDRTSFVGKLVIQ
jgi:hypothetical protein